MFTRGMSQDFNFDGGGPFGPPYGSMPNSFEPSSGGNMIFTTQSSPIQQSFPQSWSSTPGWPSFENQNHGFGLPFQGQNLGGSGYFPNQQQDYVPFDEGEDFYDNEGDMGMGMGNGHDTHNSRRNGSVSGAYPSAGAGQLRSNNRSISTVPATVSGTKAQNQQQRRPRLVLGDTNSKPTTDAGERAAQLRAKLIAQQQRKSATPTPTKSNNVADTPNKSVAGQTTNANGNMSFQSTVLPRVEDKSANALQNPASVPSTSQADIESLFSEIKAGMSGEATPEKSSVPDMDRTRATLGGFRGKIGIIKARAPTGNDQHRPDPNGNTPSSDLSELGEIREDAPDSEPAGQAPEPLSSKDSRTDKAETTAIADPKLPTKENASKPARDVAAKSASTQSGTPVITAAPVKPSQTNRLGAASSTPPQSQSTTLAPHAWKKDSKSGPGQDHRLRSGGDLNQRQPQAPGAQPNGPQHTTYDRERRYTDKDQRLSRSADNSRAAVKDHEPTDARCSEGSDADLKTVVRQQQGPSERNLIAPKTIIANNPDHVKAPANKNTEITGEPDKDYAASEPPFQVPKSTIEPSMFADQQMYEDVMDWLEMTDWNDAAYRKQSLARHRKMKALDLQRAELEREAQLEMEQRSRSVRARSTLPVETGNLHSVFSPQILRAPSGTTMAPPPVPLKEPEDLGIKIKDLANPGLQATSGNGESNRNIQPSPKVQGRSSLAMKRERGDDESKRPDRADKLPRLDLNERSEERSSLTSPMIKDESLESRITRSSEIHSAGYKRRSRSPEHRAQPLSPNARRASDANGYYDRSRGAETTRVDRWSPRASRNASPNRRDSGTRGLPLYQDLPRFHRDLESRTQHDREFEYQSNYRGRGNGRTRFQSSRGGYKPHGSRGGGQGRANGSESLNLKQGGQSRG